jgi:cytochrome c oxidase subunit 4
MPRPPVRLVVTLVVLLGLMAGNIAFAFIELGSFSPLVHVAIAVTMASIVLAVFMELDRGASLFWVFAGAGFFWLAILFFLTWADYLTRYNFASS